MCMRFNITLTKCNELVCLGFEVYNYAVIEISIAGDAISPFNRINPSAKLKKQTLDTKHDLGT